MKAKAKLTIKKYPEGTASLKKVVSKKSKPLDTYTRETTTTYETKPGSKGKLFIQEGTVQRKPTGRGVNFIPEAEVEKTTTGKIIDPKSRVAENPAQARLRKMTLDTHRDPNVDLSKRYKEGDTITYGTRTGTQVAGRIQKTADVPAEYATKTQREIEVRRKGGTIARLEGTKEQQMAKRKELEAQGYYKQAGTSSYIKDDESMFIPEEELSAYEKQGYNKSARTKEELEGFKKGVKKVKKMKIYKKGSKMC